MLSSIILALTNHSSTSGLGSESSGSGVIIAQQQAEQTNNRQIIMLNNQQDQQQQQQQQQQTTEIINFWDSITDERVNEFYLLRGGPSIILTLVIAYLYFVLSLGPKLMAKHEAFKLNKLLLFYNVGMAIANLWLFVQGLLVSNYGLDTLGCGKFGGDIRQSPRRGIYLGYLFFLTKLIELLDTVFFVLRKKHKQVTFLHVFHHSVVPLFCWIGIKLAPGGPNGFFPLVNSFIHVVMYSYYALTTFGPRVQPYLWWKKYLTSLQMIQFVLVMLNAFKTFMSQDCKFPILFAYLQATVAIAFFILFAFFYHDAYHKNKTSNNNNNYKKKTISTTTTAALVKNEQLKVSKFQQTENILDSQNNNINNNNNIKLNNNGQHLATTNGTNSALVRRLNGNGNGKIVTNNIKLL